VKGVISKKPIGSHPYTKALPGGEDRLCFIEVYPLRVTLQAVEWREMAERKRVWFSAREAAALVDEGGLAHIIEEWLELLARHTIVEMRHAGTRTGSVRP
jgi:hypothetical protein